MCTNVFHFYNFHIHKHLFVFLIFYNLFKFFLTILLIKFIIKYKKWVFTVRVIY